MATPEFRIVGLTELNARLGAVPTAVRDRVRWFVTRATQTLRSIVKANISDRFHSEGPLYQGVQAKVDINSESVTGTIFIDDVPYARIQEYGGTTPAHDILPVKAKALAFMGGGPMSFAGGIRQSSLVIVKAVHHPGSRIPERSYARTALYDFRLPFENGMREVVAEAIDDTAALGIAAE